jgi:hypothetical protein
VLTASDLGRRRGGRPRELGQCHVVGVRADGSRIILESFARRRIHFARERAELFGRLLEGYERVVVETEAAVVGGAWK